MEDILSYLTMKNKEVVLTNILQADQFSWLIIFSRISFFYSYSVHSKMKHFAVLDQLIQEMSIAQ